MTAKLIMFDGPDGVGKTTQIQLVKSALTSQGLRVLVTRINGGSPIGEELRKVYLSNTERPAGTDYHLGMAIYEAFVAEIDKARPDYDVILSDRSPLSNVAYQSFGSGYPLEQSLAGCDAIMAKLHPDKLICYTAPLSTLRNRLQQASTSKADYFESKPDSFFDKVIEGYEYATERYGAITIDGTADTTRVHEATMAAVTSLLSA